MNYSLMLWNVRGTPSDGRCALINNVISDIQPDILFMQEIKVTGFGLQSLLRSCWKVSSDI